MNSHPIYQANLPAVIAEVIDNEAIIVNLDSGAYYSLRGSACLIWEMLARQMPVPTVVQGLSQRFAGTPDVLQSGVDALLADLLGEQLLVPADGTKAPAELPTMTGSEDRPSFETPVLEKYTDMAELLLLDPIHDVDAAGWPQPAPDRQ